MKFIRPILSILIVIAIIIILFLSLSKEQKMITVVENNLEKKALGLTLKHYQDSDCGMVIDDLKFASQVVAPDGKTRFFHDHGGMIHWLEDKEFKNEAVIWVHSIDTNEWIDGKMAWYSRDEITPMKYGFGAYKNKKENLISFEMMRDFMLKGETMSDPFIKKQLLEQKAK